MGVEQKSSEVRKPRKYMARYKTDPAYRAELKARKDATAKLRPIHYVLQRLRSRAKERGLQFDLSPEDIHIPSRCPVFGIEFVPLGSKRCDASPSVDRIDNSKGYVRGNVLVVSYRANRMKADATMADLQRLIDFYSPLGNKKGPDVGP